MKSSGAYASFVKARFTRSFMNKIIEFVQKYATALGFFVVLVCVYLYVSNKISNVDKNGVVTVAKVLKWEPAEQGSDLYIEIYLEDAKVVADIDQDCPADCVGNYFFVKVNRRKLDDYPIFYGDKPVPKCILDSVKVFHGWNSVPDCDNFRK